MAVDHSTTWRVRQEPWADRAQSRPERAAEQLAALSMSAGDGERLGTKEELRAACGVSVGTFNEALRIAQARGLVTVRSGPGGGLFASRQSSLVRFGNAMLALRDDAGSVSDAFRLRHALDPLVIQDALEYASARDIAALRRIIETMRSAVDGGDPVRFLRANWSLHVRIAEICPSLMLRSVYLNLLEITESHLLAAHPAEGEAMANYMRSRAAVHTSLVDAIAAHDARALDLIQEHNIGGPRIEDAG